MKYLAGFLLLTAGSALTTAGLAMWHDQAFAFSGLWTLSGGLHPIFVLIVGIAMIPPALWEIFLLENRPRDE
ncbi:MAG: hypothetical protein OXP09_02815 [Gammaproteobacteria bacterium]|nr:hypothetical protein [Gammaproteobacteria bacterium]MDE0364486.1 hypothetical protein [Gammaproteobacteria bacterium]